MKADVLVLILLLLLIQVKTIYNNKCGTDILNINPKPLNVKNKRKMSSIKSTINSNSETPILIGYDFTTLIKPLKMSLSIYEKVRSLLKETSQEFSKILKVTHKEVDLSGQLNDIKINCELDIIGDDYQNFLIKNDLIIFPMFKSDLGEGVLAAAAPCITEKETFKPLAGIIYINSLLDFESTNSELYIKYLLFHEITHILAFHPYIFSNLRMSRTIFLNSYIVSNKVIEKAREHFGCPSLSGIPLENQGGSESVGSHWESRYMLGDYMISTYFPDMVISDMTLALFEDTGFYKVNYYSGGLFKFGKNKECDFFNKNCVENNRANFDEFCDVENEPKCSSSRNIKSKCYITNHYYIPRNYRYFSDSTKGGVYSVNYCPVPYEEFNSNKYYFSNHCQVGISDLPNEFGEKIGNESLCFISSLLPNYSETNVTSQMAICYEVECNTNNKNIIIKIRDDEIICPTDGGIIYNPLGFKGSIECPKYNDICFSNESQICNEMFSCFTKLAKKDNYSNDILAYNFEGPSSQETVDKFDTYNNYKDTDNYNYYSDNKNDNYSDKDNNVDNNNNNDNYSDNNNDDDNNKNNDNYSDNDNNDDDNNKNNDNDDDKNEDDDINITRQSKSYIIKKKIFLLASYIIILFI